MDEANMVDPRQSAGYEPRFDLDMKVGQRGESHALAIIDGIQNGTVEVKTDERAADTGNLYVEFAHKSRGKWVPSGIAKTQALYWCYVLYGDELALFVPTDVLKEYAEKHRWVEMPRGSHPTRGYLVPFAALMSHLALRERGRRTA